MVEVLNNQRELSQLLPLGCFYFGFAFRHGRPISDSFFGLCFVDVRLLLMVKSPGFQGRVSAFCFACLQVSFSEGLTSASLQ